MFVNYRSIWSIAIDNPASLTKAYITQFRKVIKRVYCILQPTVAALSALQSSIINLNSVNRYGL